MTCISRMCNHGINMTCISRMCNHGINMTCISRMCKPWYKYDLYFTYV